MKGWSRSKSASPKWQRRLAADCYLPQVGIAAYGGMGAIIENNRILNCRWGLGPAAGGPNAELPCKDLIVRENYFYNVIYGLLLTRPSSGTGNASNIVGRLVVQNNVFEMAVKEDSAAVGSTGIEITASSSTNPRRFANFIVQGNSIRPKDNDTATAATRYGIEFNSCTNAIVRENVIGLGKKNGGDNPADQAVQHDNSCSKVTVFNNRKADGSFLPAFNSASSRHDWELTDEAENALLSCSMHF